MRTQAINDPDHAEDGEKRYIYRGEGASLIDSESIGI
jgi:hypothetical protein